MLKRIVGGKCLREVLEKSVGQECCGGRSVGGECCRELVGTSVVEECFVGKCWGRV